MNVCSKFHVDPSNSCRHISLKTTDVIHMVALDETSGDHQSH